MFSPCCILSQLDVFLVVREGEESGGGRKAGMCVSIGYALLIFYAGKCVRRGGRSRRKIMISYF